MTKPRKQATMIGLAAAWGLLALWHQFGKDEPVHAPLKYVTGQSAPREAGTGSPAGMLHINADDLSATPAEGEKHFRTPKNIFAPLAQRVEQEHVPGVIGSPTATSRKAARAKRPGPTQTVSAQPVAPPPPPPGPTAEELAAKDARTELGRYKYLGYMKRQGRNQAVLAKEQKLHIVWTGETIEGRVFVKTISPTAVTLQEMTTQVEQVLPLAAEWG